MPDLGASEDRMVRRDRVPPVFSCYLQDAPRGCRDRVPGETGGSTPRATLCMGLFCGFFSGSGIRSAGMRTADDVRSSRNAVFGNKYATIYQAVARIPGS